MNRKLFLIPVLVLTLALTLCLAIFAGCTDGTPESVSYTVTVNGGSGSGTYRNGADCTVTATLGEDDSFVKWVDGAGTEISDANPYTFKVSADITLTAVTQKITKYTITVTGGTITGTELTETTVVADSAVSVTAPDTQSRPFKYWLVNGSEQVAQNPYVFTATQDMNLVAVTDEVCLVAVSGGTIGDSEEVRQKFFVGEECTVKAEEAPSGQQFVCWYIIDENGDERTVSQEKSYTFTVTESEKYYAKFSTVYTVTVNGGFIAGQKEQVNTITVLEGGSCTIELDYEQIPADQGFLQWNVGENKLSVEYTCRLDNVTTDITVNAVYGNLIKFDIPEMDANQMFRYKNDYRPLEFDRMARGTAFVEHVEYVMFYLYTAPYADKNDDVGRFIMDGKGTTGYRLATVDGQTLLELEGTPGNLWLETKNNYTRSQLFEMFAKVLGDRYDSRTPYYLAAQICGPRGSVYGSSDISEIGPAAFIQENVATHTVTVTGGTLTGTELTSVTVYEGQKVSVTATNAADFKFWLVNDTEEAADLIYEFTVVEDVRLVAVVDELFTVTVNGGTIGEGSETQKAVISGKDCTIHAGVAPENQAFAYWYELGENGEEKIVSDQEEYTFKVTEEAIYYAKFKNVHYLTVNGGYVLGKEDISGLVAVFEGESYTVKPVIPEGQGFIEWQSDGVKVSGEQQYTLENISSDITLNAVYGALVHEFNAPEMNANQMFSHKAGTNYATIELDRMKEADGTTKRTAFGENVEFVMFYIYTTSYAEKTNYVGRFILDRNGSGSEGVFRLATVNGETLLNLKGKAGDVYLDAYSRVRLFTDVFAKVLGESYDSGTPYYLAAQVCGQEGSIYAPSEISELGPQAFLAEDKACYSVTVTGGVITGTELTTVSVYEGQSVSVTATAENFKYWMINGAEKSMESTFVYLPVKDTSFVVGYDANYTVQVTGGTIGDRTESEASFSSGDECTIKAAAADEGQKFVCWYVLGENGEKIIVSEEEIYTFWVFDSKAYFAEFKNIYTVTTVYGGENDEQKTVYEGEEITIKLNLSKIPAGKGFTGWKIGEETVSVSREYSFTVTESVVITAVFLDQEHEFATPEMNTNQMFSHNATYSILEFDRMKNADGSKKTAFTDNVEYVMFYVYTSVSAGKDEYVGRFILDHKASDGGFRLATVDGQTLLDIEGSAGNMWLQTKNGYNKEKLFEMFAKVVGDNYRKDQAYYLAAQVCGEEGSIYAPSEISEIGPMAFKYN